MNWLTIYTYNENCARAGSVAVGLDKPNGDVTTHEGTEKALIADQIDTLKGNYGRFSRKRAKAILEYLRPGAYDWAGNETHTR